MLFYKYAEKKKSDLDYAIKGALTAGIPLATWQGVDIANELKDKKNEIAKMESVLGNVGLNKSIIEENRNIASKEFNRDLIKRLFSRKIPAVLLGAGLGAVGGYGIKKLFLDK